MREPQMHNFLFSVKLAGKALLNPASVLNFLTSSQNAALPVVNQGNERNTILVFRRTFLGLLGP